MVKVSGEGLLIDAGQHGADPTSLPPALTSLLTVSQLGDTQPDRNAVQSCSCLPTERRERALIEQWVGGCTHCREGVPRTDGHTHGPSPSVGNVLPPQGPAGAHPLGNRLQSGQSWGRTGDGLEGTWEPHLSLFKIKERDVFNTCVFVKIPGLQPAHRPPQYLQAE